MRLVEVKKVKCWKLHKEDNLPDICKTKKYIFKTYSCKGYPNIENCKHKTISNPYFRPYLRNDGKILE